ncbi:homeoprotein [Moelleriella libera RCEF 2490]|uniref:Homeoprotein n=1 Tax=Moelleriella libera RCEF 2490 TaxID=1081109 RepID=A0A167ZNG9_9HYPO|nr:homeoprotein [Moelleriella libera RCEF 2490]
MTTELELTMTMNTGAPVSGSPSVSDSDGATPTPPSSAKQSPSQSSSGGNNQSNSKRPPRKSTLTQQQKNQKRQRATQDQLSILELEFNKNPTPTAGVRERIAEEINMTERSVQIWFQNRRAKIKLLAKKTLETGEDIDSIPDSMRAYLAMQAMETGKGLGGSYLGRTGLMPYGHNGMLSGVIHHLTCRSLSIGKWTRVAQNTMDLIIFYSPEKCTMTYYINNDQAGYKIEYPFSYIKNIWLENNEADPSKMGGIVIELNRSPDFFMDSSSSSNGFFQCGDFTEDLQATQCMVHQLGGQPKVLTNQLAKLVSLDSFMHRHNPQHLVSGTLHDPHAISVSAPVSPTTRPSSQPNFQQTQPDMMQQHWGMNQMHSAMRPPPHGHKRQRSRSVPGPIDFAMFQSQPMPSFYIQSPADMAPPQHSPHIFAPVPQQLGGGLGHNLRIDTQAGFGLDMRQYPMSATTASPSEFPPSPAGTYLSQGPETGGLPPANYGTPYSNGAFLSPMVGADNAGALSPLPFNPAAAEPSIVEQSPPMSLMGRSGSADLYAAHENSCAVSDDGISLNEMYSKHTLTLPMHGQPPANYAQPQAGELDMDQLVQFDHVDPVSLSPESLNHSTH